ncbi:hypothetical protein P7D63_18205 [Enterococcus raffinosus]|uniref:hypothetical protein n=1 Tax=Enterococcus raffinosus TaxID=71452 RepID=UPI002890EC3C|nr:hypothetical protein [Enterococcus raffinosus]MDT2556636.1 hypothetical protein [Enterococcus raffinosus]
MENDYIVVIGSLNIDIVALSGSFYREKDSNTGEISIDIGGVGQNIEQNLIKLEMST